MSEIDPTPEMIKVGAKLIADRFEEPLDWLTEELARDVYVAMVGTRPPPDSTELASGYKLQRQLDYRLENGNPLKIARKP